MCAFTDIRTIKVADTIYICIHTRTHINVYLRIYISMCTLKGSLTINGSKHILCVYMCTHIYQCILLYLHVYVHINRYPDYQRLRQHIIYVYTHARLWMYTCVCTFICTLIGIPTIDGSKSTLHMYIHTHICKGILVYLHWQVHINDYQRLKERIIYVYTHARI